MPTTQTAAPAPTLITAMEDAARTIAAGGRDDVMTAIRGALENRSGRDWGVTWGQDPSAPFAGGAITVRIVDEQPGDRTLFARLIGSVMGEVEVWVINDGLDNWAAALLRAAGQPDTITRWED